MSKRLLILYGSQTGQAESISEQIYNKCIEHLDVLSDNNVNIERFCLDQTDKKFFINKEDTVIFVVSTTGEGEPPENACRFFRRLKRKTLPCDFVSHLSYSVLALGDTNYDRFANFGKELDNRLRQLGAKQFYHTGFGDDGVGLELGVEPWIDGLFSAILLHYNIFTIFQLPKIHVEIFEMSEQEDSLLYSKTLSQLTKLTLPLIPSKFNQFKINWTQSDDTLEDNKINLNQSNDTLEDSFYFDKLSTMDSQIYDGTIEEIRELTKSNNENDLKDRKIVLEATISVDNDDLVSYEPGDSFGFICGNSDQEVNDFLKLINMIDKSNSYLTIDPGVFKYFPPRVKLWHFVKYYLELRAVPKKSCLRHLADYCSDEQHKRRLYELSSREGADDYTKFVRNLSIGILDILNVFDSCKPPLEAIIPNVPCFVPRYYSVSCAPDSAIDHRFRIAFTVINIDPIYKRTGTQLNGVFTGHMCRLYQAKSHNIVDSLAKLNISQDDNNTKVKLFKRKNLYFKLPKNPSTPLILIAPGTGVAPFIGFLQHRSKLKSTMPVGETWLFFGCRTNQDYIYESQLKQFMDSRILTQLFVCFSRLADDENSPKYVQDLLVKHASQVYKLVHNKKAMIYVCGDAKMMSTNIFNTFVKIVEQCGNLNHENAVKYVRELQNEKRYLQDVWI